MLQPSVVIASSQSTDLPANPSRIVDEVLQEAVAPVTQPHGSCLALVDVSSLLVRVRVLEDGAAAQASLLSDVQVTLDNVAKDLQKEVVDVLMSQLEGRLLLLLEDFKVKCEAVDLREVMVRLIEENVDGLWKSSSGSFTTDVRRTRLKSVGWLRWACWARSPRAPWTS